MRQADVYVEAISTVISIVTKQFPKPELSEVLAALGAIEAHFLAGIEDEVIRQKMVDGVRALVDHQIKQNIEAGDVAQVRIDKNFQTVASA